MTDGWTIAEAVAEFERAGLPVDPRRLAVIIRNLPGFRRIGEKPSGTQGGRGDALYQISDLQRLHAALASWLQMPSSAERADAAAARRARANIAAGELVTPWEQVKAEAAAQATEDSHG